MGRWSDAFRAYMSTRDTIDTADTVGTARTSNRTSVSTVLSVTPTDDGEATFPDEASTLSSESGRGEKPSNRATLAQAAARECIAPTRDTPLVTQLTLSLIKNLGNGGVEEQEARAELVKALSNRSYYSMVSSLVALTLPPTEMMLVKALKRITDWFTDMNFSEGSDADALRTRCLPLWATDPSRVPDLHGAGPDAPSHENARERFYGLC